MEGKPRIFLLFGREQQAAGQGGLVIMRVNGKMPKSQALEELNGLQLVGHHEKTKMQKFALFDKVFDHKAFKDSQDLYELLGLSEKNERGEVTPADIKKAYRKLS